MNCIAQNIDNLPYAFCEQIGKEIRDISDEIPFEIPESWEWCRLSFANDMYTGNSINESEKKAKYTGLSEGRYYIGTKDVEFNHTIVYDNGVKIPFDAVKFRIAPCSSILMCIEGGSAGRKIAFTDYEVCFGNKLCCFVSWGLDYMFLYYYLQSPIFQSAFKENTTGIIGGVSVNTLKSMLLPVPPIDEQKRIVERLTQLVPVLDEYGKAETQLTALNTTFPESLKKSILQEAVQGKLVPQNPDDEPASVLLERIRAEKQVLIKAGKIKKDKHESVIVTRDKIPYEIIDGKERCIADEVPFEIPESWCWCRLGSISWYFDAGKSPNCIKQSVTGDEYGVITTTSIQIGFFDEKQNKVLPPNFEVNEDMKVNKGDILITRAGPMNRTGIACVVKNIHFNLILSDKTIRINMSDELFDKDYIVTVLNSPNIREQIIGLMSGMDKQQVNISQDKYKTVFIPLPPLAEQKRIVAKIEELMQYCDKL